MSPQSCPAARPLAQLPAPASSGQPADDNQSWALGGHFRRRSL